MSSESAPSPFVVQELPLELGFTRNAKYFVHRWCQGRMKDTPNHEHLGTSSLHAALKKDDSLNEFAIRIFEQILLDKTFCELRVRSSATRIRQHTSPRSSEFNRSWIHFERIWEFCGHNTDLLNEMYTWGEEVLLSKDGVFIVKKCERLGEAWRQALEGGGSAVFENCKKMSVGHIKLYSFGLELFRWRQSLIENKSYQNGEFEWDLEDTRYDSLPFESGLRNFLGYFSKSIMKFWVGFGVDFLDLTSDTSLAFLKSANFEPPDPKPRYRHSGESKLLFSVAGSGKTQRSFDLLYKAYGHYVVSGHISDDRSSVESIRMPRRGGASNDSKLIYKYTNIIDQFSAMQYISKQLFLNRELALATFQQMYKGLSPPHWLLFQTACNNLPLGNEYHNVFRIGGFDPFTPTLQVQLLHGTHGSLTDSLLDSIRPIRNNSGDAPPRLFCIDEAQCDLQKTSSGFASGTSNLRGILDGMYGLITSLFLRAEHVISGTSLRLGEAKAAGDYMEGIEKDKANSVHLPIPYRKKPKVIEQDFPLLGPSNDEGFRFLFRAHVERTIHRIVFLCRLDEKAVQSHSLWEVFAPATGRLKKEEFYRLAKEQLAQDQQPQQGNRNFTDMDAERMTEKICRHFGCPAPDASTIVVKHKDRWNRVVVHSRPLRGRYRWSVIYIEHLLSEYFLEQKLDEKAIRLQSKECQKLVKGDLRKRLQELQRSNKAEHVHMLEDLSWTAVRADLMHKPTILKDDRSMELITEGFAVTQGDQVADGPGPRGPKKQWLAEHLAVAAVIEHLREEDAKNYENILQDLLFDIQDDASGFGKASEFFLAWSLGGFLDRECLDPNSPGRQAILESLRKSDLISGSVERNKQNDRLDPRGYFLQAASKINDRPFETLEFHEWLRRVREDEPFPTFYFPSIHAGPDIVFVLKNDEHPKSRILCAIQLKTGTRYRGVVDGLLHTIHPQFFFSGAANKKTALDKELKRWKENEKGLKIVSLLVITSSSCKEFLKDEKTLIEMLRKKSSQDQKGSGIASAASSTKAALTPEVKEIGSSDKSSISRDNATGSGSCAKRKKRTRAGTDSINSASGKKQKGEDRGAVALTMRPSGTEGQGEALSHALGPKSKEGLDFYFATLEKKDTRELFGENVDSLIKIMKNMENSKREKLEDDS